MSHLGFSYRISEENASNTVNTWINYTSLRLRSICIRPSKEQIPKMISSSMIEKYTSISCIIDCIEFKVETPTSLVLRKMMYSDHKSHTTVKTFVGIALGGGFTLISNIYFGSISDKRIVVKNGILNSNLLEQGNVMANRGLRETIGIRS